VNERDRVQERARTLRQDRVPFVHARVVLAERPTSAKPGDEALVLADGTMEGFVGGSCAESTVRAQSMTLLDSGDSLLLRIAPAAEAEQPGKLTVVNPCLSGGTLEIFLQPVIPAPVVAVHGDTPIARSLLVLGSTLGYDLLRWVECEPAGTAAVVVASHGRDEESVLDAALSAGVPYVGLVASHKRGEAVLMSLRAADTDRARVHTPAGIDIGARSSEEVALSILAEIIATRPRPSARPVAGAEVPTVETAVDPVCGMAVAKSGSSLHYDHGSVRWWFCGSGCLRAFAADPAAYA
jgi:xanthine dehydrogenase accessory factor